MYVHVRRYKCGFMFVIVYASMCSVVCAHTCVLCVMWFMIVNVCVCILRWIHICISMYVVVHLCVKIFVCLFMRDCVCNVCVQLSRCVCVYVDVCLRVHM